MVNNIQVKLAKEYGKKDNTRVRRTGPADAW